MLIVGDIQGVEEDADDEVIGIENYSTYTSDKTATNKSTTPSRYSGKDSSLLLERLALISFDIFLFILQAGDRSQADVIVHEIMHSWTGNLVTNRNFEHFWLNEGFTVFLERKVAASLISDGQEARRSRDFHSLLGLQELQETVSVSLFYMYCTAFKRSYGIHEYGFRVKTETSWTEYRKSQVRALFFHIKTVLSYKIVRSTTRQWLHPSTPHCYVTGDFATNIYRPT